MRAWTGWPRSSSLAPAAANVSSVRRAIAALNHPDICQLYDIGADHLVMGYVAGSPVAPVDSVRKLLDIAVGAAGADGSAIAVSSDGTIGGKQYAVTRTAGPAKLSFHRVNPYTIESELRSDDGTLLETARTTISADGKRLTRNLKATEGGKEISWTEVYERK